MARAFSFQPNRRLRPWASRCWGPCRSGSDPCPIPASGPAPRVWKRSSCRSSWLSDNGRGKDGLGWGNETAPGFRTVPCLTVNISRRVHPAQEICCAAAACRNVNFRGGACGPPARGMTGEFSIAGLRGAVPQRQCTREDKGPLTGPGYGKGRAHRRGPLLTVSGWLRGPPSWPRPPSGRGDAARCGDGRDRREGISKGVST